MSANLVMSLQQRPIFSQLLPQSKVVSEGECFRLDCVLVGEPEPEVRFECCFSIMADTIIQKFNSTVFRMMFTAMW